jgi:hypothetical protein
MIGPNSVLIDVQQRFERTDSILDLSVSVAVTRSHLGVVYVATNGSPETAEEKELLKRWF